MANKIDTYVIVTVDTVNIEPGNENDMVEFSDNRGDTPGKGLSFTSKVNRRRKITWVGHIKDPGKVLKGQEDFYNNNSVKVKKVEMKDQVNKSNILRQISYEAKKGSGVVVGRVRRKFRSDVPEGYNITILVNGTDSYTIDPQLEMVP